MLGDLRILYVTAFLRAVAIGLIGIGLGIRLTGLGL